MKNPVEDEDLLLAVLNSSPVVDGVPTDALEGDGHAEIAERFNGTGNTAECRRLRQVRDALQATIRGRGGAVEALREAAHGFTMRPEIDEGGITWRISVQSDHELVARTVLAWSRVLEQMPGRLRACANTECNLYLIDHSRPGTARWCSMATCGNRMKARAHARRARG